MHPLASITSSSWLVLVCFLGGALIPSTSAKDYWEVGVKKHNEYRALHGVPPLELDTKLAEKADKCAEYYAGLGTVDHSCPHKGNDAGENLYQCYINGNVNWKGRDAVLEATKLWYDEIKDYDFNKNFAKNGKPVGHFTQVVWKNSKKFGMGYAVKDGRCYGVALYIPRGNFNNDYKGNVFPLTGKKSGQTSEGGAGGGALSILKIGSKTGWATSLAFSLCVLSICLLD